MRQTFVLRSTFGAIIWINDKLHNKIFTWSAQASCLLQYLEPFGAKQRAKMKHNSQIPLHQHFPSLTVLTELECPKKTPTTFLQQLQCTDFATEPMQPGLGKYDVMTLDNCLPITGPQSPCYQWLCCPANCKISRKTKINRRNCSQRR